jgi:hypothetical protein
MSNANSGSLFYFYVCLNVTLVDILVVSNWGTLIKAVDSNILLIKSNIVKINCSASAVDGCLLTSTGVSSINITDSRIEDVFHPSGGALGYLQGAKLILDNVNFDSMRANKRAACFLLDHSQLEAKGVIFTDFQVGCIYSIQSTVTIRNGHFSAKLIGANPNPHGSTIKALESSLFIKNCYFEGNVNGTYAGGVK